MDETITTLLEQGEDWLQFAVRHSLLRDDGPALTDARNRALRDPKIAGLLRDVADFHGTLVTSHKNAGLPLHKLIFLLDLGFGLEVPEIASAVEAILTHRDTRGVYQSVSRIPVRYGGTDQEVFGWALCDAPSLLTALAMAGVDFEEHVRQGFDSLTTLFRDGKFHCEVSQELGTFRGPGRRDDPCPYATLVMLRLFAAVPGGENHPQAHSAVETILDLWEHSRDKHPYIFYMGDDFRKLKAPSLWYDIVSVTDTLSRFATARSDGRFQEMVDSIRSKQDDSGMFTPESVYRAYQGWDFGQKRKPSPYLTFLCLRTNRRVWADHQAWLALSHGSAPHTLEELRLVGNQTPEAAQEPEEWWRVVEGTTYRALIRPSSADPSHFDVLLAPSEHQPPRWPTPDKPANGFSANLSNNPQEGQWLRSLPSALRDFLRDRLPPHMVPPAIVLSDELPTTGNGKVDRNLLRGPLVLSRPTEPNFIPPRTALEEQLCGIWSRVLGVDAVSVTSDFFELGGHSLMVAHLVAQVRATCQVDLPLRQFFENTSVAKTARWIETVRNGGQVDMGMPDLRAEARLDPQIAASGSSEPPLTGPVLLTGATGFLGGFLLQELLRTPGVEVLALVRDAADPVQAMARLHRSLEKLGIPEDEWMGRVRPIVGDLSKPLLGLTGKVFEALANSVERIYHNGAVVNMVLPYHTLKPANVDGTREILRLSARAGGSIPVHYISSLATLYLMRPDHPQTEIPLSFDDLDQELLRSASGGYGVSKFVAEQLVSQSGQAGIPSIIYRVGSVTGHSQTGAANTGDFLHAMLRGALQLGCLPRDVRLDPVPVDFVTRAIAHLASTDPPSGSIFHITNPRPMEVDQFVAWAENRGFPIALVDRKTWLRRINEQAARDGHNLQSFSALLQMLVDYQGLHRFMQAKIRQPDMSNTSRGLAATDISCPPVTSDLLDTYLEHFLRTGFIADHSQAPRPRSSQPRGEQ